MVFRASLRASAAGTPASILRSVAARTTDIWSAWICATPGSLANTDRAPRRGSRCRCPELPREEHRRTLRLVPARTTATRSPSRCDRTHLGKRALERTGDRTLRHDGGLRRCLQEGLPDLESEPTLRQDASGGLALWSYGLEGFPAASPAAWAARSAVGSGLRSGGLDGTSIALPSMPLAAAFSYAMPPANITDECRKLGDDRRHLVADRLRAPGVLHEPRTSFCVRESPLRPQEPAPRPRACSSRTHASTAKQADGTTRVGSAAVSCTVPSRRSWASREARGGRVRRGAAPGMARVIADCCWSCCLRRCSRARVAAARSTCQSNAWVG